MAGASEQPEQRYPASIVKQNGETIDRTPPLLPQPCATVLLRIAVVESSKTGLARNGSTKLPSKKHEKQVEIPCTTLHNISFGRCISCSFGVQPTLQGRCLGQSIWDSYKHLKMSHLCRVKRNSDINFPCYLIQWAHHDIVLLVLFIASLHLEVLSVRNIFDSWPLTPSCFWLRLARERLIGI